MCDVPVPFRFREGQAACVCANRISSRVCVRWGAPSPRVVRAAVSPVGAKFFSQISPHFAVCVGLRVRASPSVTLVLRHERRARRRAPRAAAHHTSRWRHPPYVRGGLRPILPTLASFEQLLDAPCGEIGSLAMAFACSRARSTIEIPSMTWLLARMDAGFIWLTPRRTAPPLLSMWVAAFVPAIDAT